MLQRLITLFSPADWLALAVFLVGWMGYSWYADRAARSEFGLRGVTPEAAPRLGDGRWCGGRTAWSTAALTGNLMQSVSFYANTTIYIIAGLIAIAGTLDRIISIAEDLPFARVQSREAIEAKLLLLTAVFIFAYFKFTWCLRQFNFLSILIGSAPDRQAPGAVWTRTRCVSAPSTRWPATSSTAASGPITSVSPRWAGSSIPRSSRR